MRDRHGEPGQQSAGQGVAVPEDLHPAVGLVGGDDAGVRVDHPHELNAGPEVLLVLGDDPRVPVVPAPHLDDDLRDRLQIPLR